MLHKHKQATELWKAGGWGVLLQHVEGAMHGKQQRCTIWTIDVHFAHDIGFGAACLCKEIQQTTLLIQHG